MPTITIQGTPIDFPNSGTSPNWAPAVIEFAQAVERALDLVIGPFDVPPQVLDIDAYNPGTNIVIPNLAFPTTTVRSAIVRYAVYRNTLTDTVYETGTIDLVYNPNGSVNSKWETVREFGGDGKISFSVTDSGQVRFTTLSIPGINHFGRLSFSAQALLQS